MVRQCVAYKELTSLAREKCEKQRDFDQQPEPSDVLRVSCVRVLIKWKTLATSRDVDINKEIETDYFMQDWK